MISLSGSNRIFGAYLTDTLSPSDLLHVTLSARYNRSTETLERLQRRHRRRRRRVGFDEASPLTGDHTFSRLNPAVGFTVTPSELLTYYANYNEASRAPTRAWSSVAPIRRSRAACRMTLPAIRT